MINHVRTLILNKSELLAGLASGAPGAEFIDSTFASLVLPQPLRDMRTVLLAADAGAYQENCTLAYLMRILHAPDLQTYTLMFDPRYTYSLEGDYTAQLRDVAVTTTSWKSGDCSVAVTTIYRALYQWPQQGAVLRWQLRYKPDMAEYMELQLDNAPAQRIRPVFDANGHATITLIQNYLQLAVSAPSGLTGELRYDVVFYAPVQPDIPKWLTACERLLMRYGLNAVIFEPWGPYATQITQLQDVWLRSSESILRLGACVLGYAAQCERLRLGLYKPQVSSLQKVS